MENKINKIFDAFMIEFKNDIKCYIQSHTASDNNIDLNKLLTFIYEYKTLSLTKENLQKRKRVKNFVPIYERCCAKRANDEQCTRRKKASSQYCGTHLKGTPHGIFETCSSINVTKQKVNVWAQDIKGIIYYIDNNNNVYQTEEVVNNMENPRVIAKYQKNGDIYSIPEYKI